MLCVIVEQMIPDYYLSHMIGSIVDQRIFEGTPGCASFNFLDLMKERMHNVSKHLEGIGLPIAMVCLPWFLCLFISYVPMEVDLLVYFAE